MTQKHLQCIGCNNVATMNESDPPPPGWKPYIFPSGNLDMDTGRQVEAVLNESSDWWLCQHHPA